MVQYFLKLSLTVVLATVVSSHSEIIAGTVFTDLGVLPDDSFSRASGISPNGEFVVGRSSGNVTQGFIWSKDGGMVALGDLPGGVVFSEAVAVSNTGSAVGTSGSEIDGAAGDVAFRSLGTDPIVSLGTLGGSEVQSIAHGISADGTIVVGQSKNTGNRQVAFRWTEAGGMQEFGLGTLTQDESSDVGGISADGQVIVGYGALNPTSGTEGWRWTEIEGFQELGYLPGGELTLPAAASRDGEVIVGSANSSLGREAFRWTQALGIQGLGEIEGGATSSIALAVSGDGNVIVGSSSAEFGEVAIIWDEQNGMRVLVDVLQNEYGVDLQGWHLEQATGISADGTVIVGWGTRPDGQQTSFVVAVPEPATLSLCLVFLLGGVACASRSALR